MLPVAIVLVWAGYAVGSYGYVLIKGYDISFLSWVTPLHPYAGAWPPPLIPTGRLWPHSASSKAANESAGGQGTPASPGSNA